MLFLWPGTSTLLRGQGTYVSDDEINAIVDFVGTSEPQFVKELVQLKPSQPAGEGAKTVSNRDELYEAAVDVVVREGRGSVSLLQRALGIGYGRAARLIDYMAEDGIVGEYNGSQAREVLITLEQWADMSGGPSQSPIPSTPAPPRSGRVLTVARRSDPDVDDDDEDYDEEEDDCESEEEADEEEDAADDPPLSPRGRGAGVREQEDDEEVDYDDDELEASDEDEADDDESDSSPHYRRGRESA
jgi:S-DNA-T family DNA segregation ATPase FtsK/SpoIIIE